MLIWLLLLFGVLNGMFGGPASPNRAPGGQGGIGQVNRATGVQGSGFTMAPADSGTGGPVGTPTDPID